MTSSCWTASQLSVSAPAHDGADFHVERLHQQHDADRALQQRIETVGEETEHDPGVLCLIVGIAFIVAMRRWRPSGNRPRRLAIRL